VRFELDVLVDVPRDDDASDAARRDDGRAIPQPSRSVPAYVLLASLSLVVLSLAQRPRIAAALPTFAQAYQVDCSVCHSMVPALNAYGRYVQSTAFAADLLNAYNSVIGDDLNAVGDSKQSAQSRLWHGGLALGTVLTLPGAPELFGLTFAAKQTVKGGIEQLTFHAIDDAASNGAKLILQDGARLNPAESKIASELVARGHDVVAQAPSKIGRSADFVIDGKPTELKTMANVRPDAAGHGLTDLIIKAGKQAHNVIIDARNQRGLTQVKIRSAVENAFGKTSKSDLKSVHVLGWNGSESFEIRMSRS